MSELTIGQIIKIILGVLVFVVVVVAISIFFKSYIIDFFKNVGGSSTQGNLIEFMIK